MSVGEFLVFCKDFGIYSKEKLNKTQLVEIFKVNSLFRKDMNENQFEQALRHIGSKLFGDSSGERYLMMLKELGFEDLETVKKKCKGFTQPFFSQKGDGRSSFAKIRLPSDKNLPRVSMIEIQRFRSSDVVKKVKKEELIPCDAIITITKRGGYAKKVNSMACTWQTLSSLNTDQLVGNQKIFELISEDQQDEDEELNKFYGSLKGVGSK